MPYASARQAAFIHAEAARGTKWAKRFVKHSHGTTVGQVAKAVLTAAARAKLPDSAFAIPSRRAYPINDPAHARNALARVNQAGTSGSPKTIARKVARKYPSIGKAATRADYNEHYRRQRRALGGVAALSGGLAAGSQVVGAAEHAGHDPMGLGRPEWGSELHERRAAMSPEAIARFNRMKLAPAHFKQAKVAGAIGAGALGLAALSRRREKLTKAFDPARERRKAAVLGAGTAAVGGAGALAGHYNVVGLAGHLQQARADARGARTEDKLIAAAHERAAQARRKTPAPAPTPRAQRKAAKLEQARQFDQIDPWHKPPGKREGAEIKAWNAETKAIGRRVTRVKGPAVAAGAALSTLGTIAAYHGLRGPGRRGQVSKGAGMANFDNGGNAVGHRWVDEPVAKADSDRKVKAGLAGLGLGAAAYKGGDVIQHGAAETVRRAARREGAAGAALAAAKAPAGPSTVQRVAGLRRGAPVPSGAVNPKAVAGAERKLATATRRTQVTGLRMQGLATRGRNVKLAGIGAAALGTGALVSAMRKPKQPMYLTPPGY